MVDALDLGSSAVRYASSNLAFRMFYVILIIIFLGYSQEVKASVFDTDIPGSNPGTPVNLNYYKKNFYI